MVRPINYYFLYVVEGQGPSLMGREWRLNEITIDWQKLNMAADASDKVAPAKTDVEGLLKNIKMFSRMALG